MRNVRTTRFLWAWIATALLALVVAGMAVPASATQEWHLQLNDVNTASGDPCGSSIVNPWDGNDDYLLGSYYDTGNSGLTFKYSYDGGSNWVTPGASSHFGDELFSGFYWFHDGSDGPYQIPDWSGSVGATFIIRAIGGSGTLDFTCDIP